MAASRPSWIRSNSLKDTYYPIDIQNHLTKFEKDPTSGFKDIIDIKIQNGRQSAILDLSKILKRRALPHWYTDSPYQIWKQSVRRFLRYNRCKNPIWPPVGHLGCDQNFEKTCIAPLIHRITIPNLKTIRWAVTEVRWKTYVRTDGRTHIPKSKIPLGEPKWNKKLLSKKCRWGCIMDGIFAKKLCVGRY